MALFGGAIPLLPDQSRLVSNQGTKTGECERPGPIKRFNCLRLDGAALQGLWDSVFKEDARWEGLWGEACGGKWGQGRPGK